VNDAAIWSNVAATSAEYAAIMPKDAAKDAGFSGFDECCRHFCLARESLRTLLTRLSE
jgi:hypothetical protein